MVHKRNALLSWLSAKLVQPRVRLSIFGLLYLMLAATIICQPPYFKALEQTLFSSDAIDLTVYAERAVLSQDIDFNVVTKFYAERFLPQQNRVRPSADGTSTSVWLRFRLDQLPEYHPEYDYAVFFDDAFAPKWTLYVPEIESSELRHTPILDESDATYSKGIFANKVIAAHSVKSDYYYIEYPREKIVHRLLLQRYDHFYQTQIRIIIFMVLNLGFLFGMLVMNGLLHFSTKKSYYFYHLLFLCSALVMLYFFSSLGRLIGARTHGNMVLYLQVLTIVAANYFGFNFLDIRVRGQCINTLYRIMLATGTIGLLAIPFLSGSARVIIGQTLSAVLMLFLCVLSLIIYLKEHSISIFYITGLFLIMLAGSLSILSSFGTLPLSYMSYYFVFVAFSLESVLFTSGIMTVIREQKSYNSYLVQKVGTDALTGLKNRHFVDSFVKPELLSEKNINATNSLIMFDIDFFKNVNDTYGHDVGDKVLQALSHAAMSFFRRSDYIIRWGGEEFAVFLPDTPLGMAKQIGENFRKVVENYDFKEAKSITISLGVAEKSPEESFENWFKRVDDALYLAKNTGRNRIEVGCYLAISHQTLVSVDWISSYECGNALIDSQHKELLTLINALIQAYLSEQESGDFLAIFYNLIAQTARHFHDEEAILEEIAYPDVEAHKNIHAVLIEKTLAVKACVDRGSLDFNQLLVFAIGEIVVGHMKQEDVRFYAHIARHMRQCQCPPPAKS